MKKVANVHFNIMEVTDCIICYYSLLEEKERDHLRHLIVLVV